MLGSVVGAGRAWLRPRAPSSSRDRPAAAAEKPPRELDPAELLAHLGGDSELAQAFCFLPHAFLGCDWSGTVHVSVVHDNGVHNVTLSVSPEAARLLEGIDRSREPMLTVASRREILLDVLAGRLEATRAVMTGKVQVSELSKLVVFKSAFKLKRAVFEAYAAGRLRTWRLGAKPGARARLVTTAGTCVVFTGTKSRRPPPSPLTGAISSTCVRGSSARPPQLPSSPSSPSCGTTRRCGRRPSSPCAPSRARSGAVRWSSGSAPILRR